MWYSAGRTGWPDTYKDFIKWESGEFYARVMADLPRILFGHQRDKLTYARLALSVKKWLKHGQQKLWEQALQPDTNVWPEGGLLLNIEQDIPLKKNEDKDWCCSLTKKVAFRNLLLNERHIAAEIWSRRPVFGVVIAVKLTSWRYEHISCNNVVT